MQSQTTCLRQYKIKVLPMLMAIWVGIFLFACTSSLIQKFPPADQSMLNHAKRSNPAASMATLDRGRQLYLTKCSNCHSIYRVGKYDLWQWQEEILPDMSLEAKLSPQQKQDITLYVLSLRQLLAQRAAVR